MFSVFPNRHWKLDSWGHLARVGRYLSKPDKQSSSSWAHCSLSPEGCAPQDAHSFVGDAEMQAQPASLIIPVILEAIHAPVKE